MDESELNSIAGQLGIEVKGLINRKSKVFKDLKEDFSSLSEARAVEIMTENPKTIKRPILLAGEEILLGFDEEEYREILG